MKEDMIFNYDKFQFRKGIVEKILKIIDKQDQNQGKIVFLGDSLVEMMPEVEGVVNNGIGGLTSSVLENLIDELAIKFQPRSVYIHIGTNDLGETSLSSPRTIAINVSRILMILKKNLPNTKLNLISTLPCLDTLEGQTLGKRGIRSNRILDILNEELIAFMPEGTHFINLAQYLVDDQGQVIESFYEDQLHLNSRGYEHLKQFIDIQ